eukprot:Gregarina_sp_Poly_1__10482@NODE_766_length_6375_cov_28_411382_g563_i0_p1_GENE_NODE_766_length_6375_cov_28_411382_g563_i0NODE_766_length_6375_cov_28_411382_g563_i0_p1_ORF_typecomplete_len573_score80_70_NODE_766_length_6375_cov_28_411382_g563_i03752093
MKSFSGEFFKDRRWQIALRELIEEPKWEGIAIPWIQYLPEKDIIHAIRKLSAFGSSHCKIIAMLRRALLKYGKGDSEDYCLVLGQHWNLQLNRGRSIRDLALTVQNGDIPIFARWAKTKGDSKTARAALASFVPGGKRRKLLKMLDLDPMDLEDANDFLRKENIFFNSKAENGARPKMLPNGLEAVLHKLSLDTGNVVTLSEHNRDKIFETLSTTNIIGLEHLKTDRRLTYISLSWRDGEGRMHSLIMDVAKMIEKDFKNLDTLLQSKAKIVSFRRMEDWRANLTPIIREKELSNVDLELFNWKNCIDLKKEMSGMYMLPSQRFMDYVLKHLKISIPRSLRQTHWTGFQEICGPDNTAQFGEIIPWADKLRVGIGSAAAVLAYEENASWSIRERSEFQKCVVEQFRVPLDRLEASHKTAQFWVFWEHYAWILHTLGFTQVRILEDPFDLSSVQEGDVVVLPHEAIPLDSKTADFRIVQEARCNGHENLFATLLHLRGLDVLKDEIPCLHCGGLLVRNDCVAQCSRCEKSIPSSQIEAFKARNTKLFLQLAEKKTVEVANGLELNNTNLFGNK